MGKIADVQIDGVRYPCDEWRSVESGQILEERWEHGFDGGLGELVRKTDRGTYTSVYMDVSSPPYARMVTAYTTINSTTYANLAALDMSYPLYAFYIESGTSANEYVYLLNGRYGYKLDLDDSNALEDRKDFGAGAVCGRPALFEDKWYVPLGGSVNAATLTAANCADSGADTWTTAGGGYNANHFATIEDDGVSKLAVASGNTVGFSADGTAPTTTWEVGESTLDITDLLAWQGELLVIKPNGPWRFDNEGHASRVQDMIDLGRKSLTPKKSGADDPYEGSNSFVQGKNAYWVDAAGLWRITGSLIYPVGFEAADDYVNLNMTGAPLLKDTDAWRSFRAWGRYCYGTNNRGLFQGRILSDGTIHWLSGMEAASAGGSALRRCVITEGKNQPLLWMVLDGSPEIVACFPLNQDGSSRADLGDARGGVGITGLLYLPLVNFGMLDKQKQMRRMWAITEGLDSDNTFKFQYALDRATSASTLGSEYSSAGTHEATWTPGSGDMCYEAEMILWLKIAGGGTPADPRVRACGIQAVTPEVYRVVIPVTPNELRGRNMSVAEALKRLRNLKNSDATAIAEPGFDATFNGYIRSTSEESLRASNGELVHNMILFIERYDWTDNA